MRVTRKVRLIGSAAAATLLVLTAAVAVGSGWLGRTTGQDAVTSPGDGVDTGAPLYGTLSGVAEQKQTEEELAVRSDAATDAGTSTEPAALMLAADGRRLVRTADLSLVVDGHDVTQAVDRVVVITQGLGGYVLYSYTGSPGDPVLAYPEDDGALREGDVVASARTDAGTATVTVRVPARSFETALRRFGKLGDVEYQSTSAEDVGDQMVDLEARLRHARAVERRLLRFLEQTDTVREMLAVQDRLDQVQLQIEQLTAQIDSLREIVAFSPITVSLRAEGDPTPVIGAGGGVWGNFVDAWRLLGRSAGVLLMALAAALPFVIVFGSAAAAIWYGARRLGRRRSRGAGAAGPA